MKNGEKLPPLPLMSGQAPIKQIDAQRVIHYLTQLCGQKDQQIAILNAALEQYQTEKGAQQNEN